MVTGASRGIGAEIARWLGGAGAAIALVARTKSLLDELVDEIGESAFAVEADLASVESAKRAAEIARDRFGAAPDILVNNAGVFDIVELQKMDVSEFARMLDVNLLAPFALLRAYLPEMRERRSGHIVNIGSVADRTIYPGNAGYSATKFGMRAMHEVLRAETVGTGVRATLISPSGVNTDMWEAIRLPGSDEPFDRSAMMSPAAVANAVMFALLQPEKVNVDELRLSSA